MSNRSVTTCFSIVIPLLRHRLHVARVPVCKKEHFRYERQSDSYLYKCANILISALS